MTDDRDMLFQCQSCGGYYFDVTNGGVVICQSTQVGGCGWRGEHPLCAEIERLTTENAGLQSSLNVAEFMNRTRIEQLQARIQTMCDGAYLADEAASDAGHDEKSRIRSRLREVIALAKINHPGG